MKFSDLMIWGAVLAFLVFGAITGRLVIVALGALAAAYMSWDVRRRVEN